MEFASVEAKGGYDEYQSHRAARQPQQRNDANEVGRKRFGSEVGEIEGTDDSRPDDDQECTGAVIPREAPPLNGQLSSEG